jgi:methionyl-tRNA synthetase
MDAWRYYLVTQGPLGATDADFVADRFQEIYNAHLVNTVGNSTSRVTAMINKYYDGVVPSECNGETRIEISGFDWPAKCDAACIAWAKAMEAFELTKAIDEAMCLIREVDLFINDTAPFTLAKDESKQKELGAILYQCIETLRIAMLLLSPVIPNKTKEFHEAIQAKSCSGNIQELARWGGIKPGAKVTKVALFPRV